VIASGGAGTKQDIYQVLVEGRADAVLAAGIFHFGVFSIGEIKEYLAERRIPIRI
jgi:cyclase